MAAAAHEFLPLFWYGRRGAPIPTGGIEFPEFCAERNAVTSVGYPLTGFGRSLRIGSSRSIVVWRGGLATEVGAGCGVGGSGASITPGISAMQTYPARRAM